MTKKYFDNVFGFIRLNEAETKVVNTPIFQRLHFIRQMGLASLVFPGATHSRFAHSLGVFHITCRMLDHILAHCRTRMPENDLKALKKDYRALRMAALLHDIGHFPLSHAFENAVDEHSREQKDDDQIKHTGSYGGRSLEDDSDRRLHEEISALMVCKWDELRKILNRHRIDHELVANVIVGADIHTLYNMMLHSELDADRLDYLIRDSAASGVTYGRVDIDHIIDKLRVHCTDRGCILGVHEGDTRSVEHYVLARYFMYTQVMYHPKMVFLEEIVKRILKFMINISDNDSRLREYQLYDETKFREHITNNDFHAVYDYNDNLVMHHMRRVHDMLDKEVRPEYNEASFVNDAIKVILSGQIPAPLAQQEVVGVGYQSRARRLDSVQHTVATNFERIARELGMPRQRMLAFYPHLPVSKSTLYARRDANIAREAEQDEAIRVIFDNGAPPDYLMDNEASILQGLQDHFFQAAYVFALQVPHHGDKRLDDELRKVPLDEIDRVASPRRDR